MSRLVLAAPAILVMACCSSDTRHPAAEPVQKADIRKPKNETRRFPSAGQVDTTVIDNHLLGKGFMPGGTIAHYRRGATQYDLFVAEFPSSTDASIALANWEMSLQGAKLIPTFGGYFGTDRGLPVFVFPKDTWLAGVVGLAQKEADFEARVLAARLN